MSYDGRNNIMDIFNNRNSKYGTVHNNKKKERKKMVEFKYNEMMERWDIELPYKLGDLKEMKSVASIEDEEVDGNNRLGSTITFWKPLSITDVRSIVLHYDELKFQLERNPLEDLKPEVHFELDPDGTDDE